MTTSKRAVLAADMSPVDEKTMHGEVMIQIEGKTSDVIYLWKSLSLHIAKNMNLSPMTLGMMLMTVTPKEARERTNRGITIDMSHPIKD